jgi:hypothetical protein
MSEQPQDRPADGATKSSDQGGAAPGGEQQIVVVGPDGQPIGTVPASVLAQAEQAAADHDGGGEGGGIGDLVQQPGKVMRIGTMVKQLLEEVKAAPLDEASRTRLKEIHASSVKELEEGLAPELVEELERLSLPFAEDAVPSEGELRIAQAQLVGWLEGLFHGIQAAMYAQQMSARAQVEQLRRALPGGAVPGAPGGMPGQPQPGRPGQAPGDDTPSSGGMYL